MSIVKSTREIFYKSIKSSELLKLVLGKASPQRFFAQNVKEVHTAEIKTDIYSKTAPKLKAHYPHVTTHLGNSPEIIRKILKGDSGSKKTLFYLDAHWYSYWPLLNEIEEIAKSVMKHNCIIMVDDIQVPGRPDLHFDSYEGKTCNFEYVHCGLKSALGTNFHYEYITPPEGSGCLVAMPKNWKKP